MTQIFLAVDTAEASEAKYILDILGDEVGVKFGLEFIYANKGLDICNLLAYSGKKRRPLFIDAKINDIPATNAGAIRSIIRQVEPDYISIHATDDIEAMIAAVKAADQCESEGYSRGKILGVISLSSASVDFDVVEERAEKAYDAGLDGFICSGPMVKYLRDKYIDMYIMTPGIRSLGVDVNDQKQVLTPAQAVKDGANGLVIGREITNAKDPVLTVISIKNSIINS